MIWYREFTVQELNQSYNIGLSKHLDIHFSNLDESSLEAIMNVSENHHQPFQVLNGGASLALAETVGSCAGNMVLDLKRFMAVGQEINANHLRSHQKGNLTAMAKPFHLGKKSQVWSVEIKNEEHQLVCISRLTLAVIEKKS